GLGRRPERGLAVRRQGRARAYGREPARRERAREIPARQRGAHLLRRALRTVSARGSNRDDARVVPARPYLLLETDVARADILAGRPAALGYFLGQSASSSRRTTMPQHRFAALFCSLLVAVTGTSAADDVDTLARDVERLESLRAVKDLQRSYTHYLQAGL